MPDPKAKKRVKRLVKTTHGPREFTIFDDKIQELKESGRKLLVDDARKKIAVVITEEHARVGEAGNENTCVVALGSAASIDEESYMSIGDCIAKILYFERAKVLRYQLSSRIIKAIHHFDTTKKLTGKGEWILKPGTYYLTPPRGPAKLTKNKTMEEKQKDRGKWDRFEQRIAKEGPKGEGMNRHRSRSISTRQVTIVKA